ncbi:hypothetical protein CDEST_03224 [Colletotrichum destructivum]|uniref:Uncharacterized protein n=1 Tax=Colletotrichum destructivum TaxID=34406 RepID=A0AAX4I5D7_9PEZI|nr:hypothetical protein CDEST_03224 [Colletotrichum destructivum]
MVQGKTWILPPRNVGDVGHVLANRCLSDPRIFIVVSLFTFLAPSQGAARSSLALEKSLAGRHPPPRHPSHRSALPPRPRCGLLSADR